VQLWGNEAADFVTVCEFVAVVISFVPI